MGKNVSCTIGKCSCSWAKLSFSVLHKIFGFLSDHPKGDNLAEENCKVQGREQMLTQLKWIRLLDVIVFLIIEMKD